MENFVYIFRKILFAVFLLKYTGSAKMQPGGYTTSYSTPDTTSADMTTNTPSYTTPDTTSADMTTNTPSYTTPDTTSADMTTNTTSYTTPDTTSADMTTEMTSESTTTMYNTTTFTTTPEMTTTPFCEIPEEDEPSADTLVALNSIGHGLMQSWFGAETFFLVGNATAKKGAPGIIRKEYRQMTKEEMKAWHEAVNKIKDTKVYDQFVADHNPTKAKAAHFGMAFLPWHRHFLYLLEQELIKERSNAVIPYWDSACDYPLPSTKDAAIWTEEFWGEAQGAVKKGPHKQFKIIKACQHIGKKLKRASTDDKDHLYSKKKIDDLLKAASYEKLMTRPAGKGFSEFEKAHGLVHHWVGTETAAGCNGHMGCVPCSPSDPTFWMHHAFVDCLWEEWLDMGNVNKYPVDGVAGLTLHGLGGTVHRKDSPMFPFPGLTNEDGMRKGFYPGYKERPSKITCTKDAECMSPEKLLWCHPKQCCCIAKIKEGGKCDGFKDLPQACYCKDGTKTPTCKKTRKGFKCVCN